MLRTVVVLPILLLSLACHPSRPIIDTGPLPIVDGTISGMVNSNGGVPISGRKVTAINVQSGAKVEASTTSTGGYTVRVRPGTYRFELEVRSGEMVTETPKPTEVEPGDLDAGRNFTLSPAPKN